MKIVYCIPSLHNSGGMERVLSQKANYFVEKLGWEIIIVTSSQKNRPTFYPLSSKVKLVDLDIDYESIFNLPIHKRIISRIKAIKTHKKKLQTLLYELKPDVTVSMFTHEMRFLPDIQDGSRKVLELHFSKNYRKLDARSNNQSFVIRSINQLLEFIDCRSIKYYDKFVVLSHKDAKDWGNLDNISVIYNPTAYSPDYNSPLEGKKVLAVGRLCAQKGFDMLIDIWNIMPDDIKENWHLDILGDGPEKEMLQKKINQYNLGNKITILPPTSKIERDYKRHDIFCFTSRYEGFGLSLLEAMSFGLPAVSFDCPCGPSEMIEDEETGFIIPAGNIDLFKMKLESLMRDKSLRIKIGKAAFNYTRHNFSEQRIMKQWYELFTSL